MNLSNLLFSFLKNNNYLIIIICILLSANNAFCKNQNSVNKDITLISKNDSLKSESLFLYIKEIIITGNKKTKNEIILRELSFNTIQNIDLKNLEKEITKSTNNLTNLNLFNFIEISYNINEQKDLFIKINIVERWYIWPYPIFEISERNFNSWWQDFKSSNYKDLSRVNYGLFLNIENFRGRNELIILKYRQGFKEHYLLNYKIPFFKKNQSIGLNSEIQLFRRKKTHYQTINNELQYLENKDNFTSRDFNFNLEISYRKGIKSTHNFGAEFFASIIDSQITILNPYYLNNNKSSGSYLKFSYNYLFENRDNANYPLRGTYLNIQLAKNLKILSPVKHFEFNSHIEGHKFFGTRFSIGSSFRSRKTFNNNQTYFAQQTFGFEDYVRGYELYVVDGKDFWLSKSSIKYCLVQPKNFIVPYFKTDQFKKAHYAFYISLFSDLGYANDMRHYNENSLSNSMLWGKGLSLDYVTYYNKMIRLEFTINKLGEKGVFLHFSNPFGTNK